MKRALTAVVLIPIVLLVVFRAPLWLFGLAIGTIVVLALHEYLQIVEAVGIRPFSRLVYVAGMLPLAGLLTSQLISTSVLSVRHYYAYPVSHWFQIGLLAAFITPILFGIPLVFRKELASGLASVAASAFAIPYIAVALSLLVEFRSDNEQTVLIVFVLFSVWAGDIAAYYVGRAMGKHKLAPVVSPNKSWEGAVASIIASVAVAFLVFYFRGSIQQYFVPTTHWPSVDYPVKTVHVFAVGLLTNIAAQFGDLFESALKRGAGLKDSGTLLPGHGGILDRIDALLFAIPAVWYYANFTGFLKH